MINQKYLAIGVIAVVAIGFLWYTGYLDTLDPASFVGMTDVPPPENSDRLYFSKGDIHSLLVIATGKPLNRETTERYIDKLNMKLYGSDSHYTVIANQYRNHFSDWMKVLDSGITDGVVLAWQNGDKAASIITATKPAFLSMFGHQTVTLTAEGSVDDYTSFYTFVMTS